MRIHYLGGYIRYKSDDQPSFNYNGINYNCPLNGGYQLNSRQSQTFEVTSDWFNARIWPRTGCDTMNGQFKCETGDCGPFVECSSENVPRQTWKQPVTLAEFGLNKWNGQDFLDISLVDGFNVPMQIKFTNPSGPSKYWCSTISCESNINDNCPKELQITDSDGQVIACNNPCTQFNTDEYCCTGSYSSRETCKPTDYSSFFKSQCL